MQNLQTASDSSYVAFGRDLIDAKDTNGVWSTWERYYTNPPERGVLSKVKFPSHTELCWLVPLEIGKGPLSKPTKQLETPAGTINIYKTTNGVNELSSRIIQYWAYNAQTGEFLSYGSRSLWNSDRFDYINWEKRLLSNFCEVQES